MFEFFQERWAKIQAVPEARMVIWITVLIVVICIGVYLLNLIRNLLLVGDSTETDHLASFRELRDQGKLDETEYEQLKKVMIHGGRRSQVDFQPKSSTQDASSVNQEQDST